MIDTAEGARECIWIEVLMILFNTKGLTHCGLPLQTWYFVIIICKHSVLFVRVLFSFFENYLILCRMKSWSLNVEWWGHDFLHRFTSSHNVSNTVLFYRFNMFYNYFVLFGNRSFSNSVAITFSCLILHVIIIILCSWEANIGDYLRLSALAHIYVNSVTCVMCSGSITWHKLCEYDFPSILLRLYLPQW